LTFEKKKVRLRLLAESSNLNQNQTRRTTMCTGEYDFIQFLKMQQLEGILREKREKEEIIKNRGRKNRHFRYKDVSKLGRSFSKWNHNKL
jgi:hypothetical protein